MSWHFDLAMAVGGRAEQQDRAELFAVPGGTHHHLVVVADGMGGQRHGALAAQTVMDTARRELQGLSGRSPREGLTQFCHAAHAAIRDIGRRLRANPASTCTALYLKGDEAYWIHVGDSRLYHFNGERQLFRTSDHTLGALLQRRDASGDSNRPRKPRDNRLYMCLGGHNELEPEFGAAAIGPDDWFMLCSDGFWNQVPSAEAASSVKATDRAKAADGLVQLAARRGGARADNVSLILATPRQSRAKRSWWRPRTI